MKDKIFYVAGAFFKDGKISLIKKLKGPSQLIGKLNFFGGKIEENEFAIDAMKRECEEETGIITTSFDWKLFCELVGEDYKVYFFKCNYNGKFDDLRSMEVEPLDWYKINQVLNTDKIVENLNWIIPMAMDKNISAVVFEN